MKSSSGLRYSDVEGVGDQWSSSSGTPMATQCWRKCGCAQTMALEFCWHPLAVQSQQVGLGDDQRRATCGLGVQGWSVGLSHDGGGQVAVICCVL